MKKHYRSDTNCLNCGATVAHYFCSNCGQENLELHDSFWHLAAHGVGHYFHFDSKFFNSVVPLLTKPGYLTKEYFAGKRASHLHPVSMYLFISVLFFFLFLGNMAADEKREPAEMEETVALPLTAGKPMPANGSKLGGARRGTNLVEPPGDTAGYKGVAEALALEQAGSKQTDDFFGFKFTTADNYEARQLALPEATQDNLFLHYTKKKLLTLWNDEEAAHAFKENFLHNIPKMMFLLLPLFAFIMMLAFPRAQRSFTSST